MQTRDEVDDLLTFENSVNNSNHLYQTMYKHSKKVCIIEVLSNKKEAKLFNPRTGEKRIFK